MIRIARLCRAAPRSNHSTSRLLTASSVISSTDDNVTSKLSTAVTHLPTPQSTDMFEADAVSGAPPEISRRQIRIYKPSRTAMQQGTNKADDWRIEFEVQSRWENPLIGWTSSGDPMQATFLKFTSKQDAIRFAERQGYDYFIDEPKVPKFTKSNYNDNFKYCPTKLRYIKTK
ncbi:hypothetical protein SeMB42_g07208 [Synchytrium endobioticum]|uniref:NADH dehydrogenase [ubiquinone] iron-sulfur protein 4, mitochondrial n=1 Tax=Synchytrium endobioticum TaxID=286115 RepID=A0A507DDN1_9FUNG|nr:hypothetical protein SeMB42_g07208 [Synchytrium endobioticum]TPX49415.1 hypothetical protein SeLEV6574_g01502 [Synchytrium endobioticum]